MQTSRTIRLFVSSTFADMQVERDGLQRLVFPRLHDLCLSMGMRFQAIDIKVSMPSGLSEADRKKLERAAEGCPIKHSFSPDIPVTVSYAYPD